MFLNKNMDCVEIEEIVDVPDTPDRLLAHNKNGYANKLENKSSNNHHSVRNGDFDARYRIPPRDKNKMISDIGSRRLFNHSRDFSNSTISRLGNPYSSSKCKNIVEETSEEKEKRHFIKPEVSGKGKALLNSHPKRSTCQSDGRFVDLTEQNSPAHVYKYRSVLGDRLLGRAEDVVKSVDNSCKLNVELGNKCIGSPTFDRGKGIADTVDARSTTSPRLSGKKRLVRNGCISPFNIAKIKQSTEKHDDNTSAHGAQNDTNIVASDASPNTVDIRELIAEARNSKRFKGKEASHRLFSSNESDTLTVHQSQSDTIGDASSCFEGLDGWRTTRNHSKKVDISLPDDHQHVSRRSSDSYVDDQQHKNLQTVNALHKRQRPAQTLTSPGECSMSSFVDSELLPSAETSSMRLNGDRSFHSVDNGDSIIDLDFSPDMRTNRDSTVTKRQEEADELLARELQEQLYNEVPEVGVEIDEHMAFALQEEETSLPHPPRRRHRLLRPSHSSLLDIVEQSRHLPPRPAARRGARVQASTSTRGTRGRNRFPGRPRTLLWTSTSSVFPEDMNVDMRMHILEQAEAFTDMDTLDRDFNENDYEMLLALDENNHRHSGASRAQINGLPQSTVQSENLEDCAICLDTPTIGQTIRHLPCLHSFHKACIDPWLKRKSSCPVCKSSIT